MKKGKYGLTLMELLVVIGIIVLLAGLFFGVFSLVRERARLMHCFSNLSQVHKALMMYAQDWDGFVPPYTNSFFKHPDYGYDTTPYTDPSLLNGAFSPYSKNRDIWFCPYDLVAGMEPSKVKEMPNLILLDTCMNHVFTSYEIAYWIPWFSPVSIDHRPPYPPFPSKDPKLFEDDMRMWRVHDSKIYLIDPYHSPEGRIDGDFTIELTFDGRVVKHWWSGSKGKWWMFGRWWGWSSLEGGCPLINEGE